MSLSPLYIACRNGDLDIVQQLLSTLTLDEINQIEPDGSTSLHAACYFNHPQIVKLLLDSGALRTTTNSHGRTAFDAATTKEIKQLFYRPFTEAQEYFSSDVILGQAIEWVSATYGRFGWQNKRSLNNIDVTEATDGIVKDDKFQDTSSTHKIEYLLKKARQTQNPVWLVKAYSAETCFCQAINRALAVAPPALQRLSAKGDIYAFVGVFVYHETLKPYRYAGKCYRGMKLSEEDFKENYTVGNKLMIKPFISTSKSRKIAEQYALAPSIAARPLSILCIYTIPDRTLLYEDNVVLDISSISEYSHEEEVLILPYTSLEVISINHLSSGLIEIRMGWYSFQADVYGDRVSYKFDDATIEHIN